MDAQLRLADHAGRLREQVDERTVELTTANLQLLAEIDERKRLEGEVAGAVEAEQERLGQELHDGLAQELAGIGMLLHVLAQQLTGPSPSSRRRMRNSRLL